MEFSVDRHFAKVRGKQCIKDYLLQVNQWPAISPEDDSSEIALAIK